MLVVVDVLGDVDDLVDRVADLESVWVHLFADLALEFFPVEAANVGHQAFFLFLKVQPAFNTAKVDKADGAGALARNDQWVLLG